MYFSLNRLKYKLQQLPNYEKIIGLGSLFVILSSIMPWYSDLDAWGVGNSYSGLSGPLYLIGFFILSLGIFSGLILFGRTIFQKTWKFPLKDSLLQLAISSLTLFFLIIANSVFFHKDFGVNILRKETRFGMFISFIGSILIGLGGYLQNKEEEKSQRLSSESKSVFKPLIDLNDRKTSQNRAIKSISITEKKPEEVVNLQMDI